MAQHIIWKNADNTLVIDNMSTAYSMQDINKYVESRIAKQIWLTNNFCAIVNSRELPSERYFRNAWRWNGAAIEFDLEACKERHLDKLRRVRNAKLQESDSDFMRALEQGNQITLDTLKAYRQALRDMPQSSAAAFTNATSPDAVRAIRPTILGTPKP